MDDIVEPGDDVDVLDAAYDVILLAKNGLNGHNENKIGIKRTIRLDSIILCINQRNLEHRK